MPIENGSLQFAIYPLRIATLATERNSDFLAKRFSHFL